MAKFSVDISSIELSIRRIRDEKVILDQDLAELYGVETKRLNEQVRRNASRFPADFMFQLTNQEFSDLRSQSATSRLWGGRRANPLAFTEQGVAMLSSVLHSKRAIQVNVEIMRTFVRLRRMLSTHAELSARLEQLEMKYDKQFASVFAAIRQLMKESDKPKSKIGYKT